MPKSTFELEDIVKSGGAVTVRSSKYSRYQLEVIAAAAKEGGGNLIIIDEGDKSRFELQDICGSGNVTLLASGKRSKFELMDIASTGASVSSHEKMSKYDAQDIASAKKTGKVCPTCGRPWD